MAHPTQAAGAATLTEDGKIDLAALIKKHSIQAHGHGTGEDVLAFAHELARLLAPSAPTDAKSAAPAHPLLRQALAALDSCGAGAIEDGGQQWFDAKLVDAAHEAITSHLAAPSAQDSAAPSSVSAEDAAQPCPFCGSHNVSDGEALCSTPGGGSASQSMCFDCGAYGPLARLAEGEIDYGSTKAKAAWNRRTPPAPAAAPQAGEPVTPAVINALPQSLRDYIHELEARSDPAGTVRELVQLRDTNAGLQKMYRRAAESMAEVIGCFDAAAGEGLAEALAETPDERLKDLVERRLMHAQYAAARALAQPQPGITQGDAS